MKSIFTHNYNDIIKIDNLLLAWSEFIVGKNKKQDVKLFSLNLMDNIIRLHEDLASMSYEHGGYHEFFITDPKRRHIHKASVRDRLLHHAIYRILYPFFDKTFINDSYSCRINKGVHKAINQFNKYSLKVSKNNTKACWVLKCDIRKFFASINHNILIKIIESYIVDKKILWLIKNIIDSFGVDNQKSIGLPLGNLTSQLLTNIYMNVFDQFVKHKLKVKYYIRYADDFVFLFEERNKLDKILMDINNFLQNELNLSLHKDKLFINTFSSGMDFLGWVHFSSYRTLRKNTKNRMFNRIQQNPTNESLQSYLGLLKHGNTFKVKQELLNKYWLLK